MITMILLILLLEALYLLYVRGVNMAEPIEIVIRKTQETSTQGTATKGGEKTPKKDENTTQKAIKTALVSAGKNMASYGASQYGNITGNTIAQRQIDNALNIAVDVGFVVGMIPAMIPNGSATFFIPFSISSQTMPQVLVFLCLL